MNYNKLSYKGIHFKYDTDMDFENFMVEISLVNWVLEGQNKPEMDMKFANKSFKKIPIDYEMFDRIFSELLTLNFNELLIQSDTEGFDGSNLEVSIYYGDGSISLSVWCYDYNYKKRGLEKIYNIYNELKTIYDENRKK